MNRDSMMNSLCKTEFKVLPTLLTKASRKDQLTSTTTQLLVQQLLRLVDTSRHLGLLPLSSSMVLKPLLLSMRSRFPKLWWETIWIITDYSAMLQEETATSPRKFAMCIWMGAMEMESALSVASVSVPQVSLVQTVLSSHHLLSQILQ